VRGFLPGAFYQPAEGRPGYFHLSGSGKMIHPQVVRQADRLIFINGQYNRFE
jgi:hypothetical protein